MKPEKALLHTASAVLHILRQCRKMLHTPTGVLHKNESFSDEATSLWSIFRFTPNMKHSAYAPYDLSSIALRATDDEKMKNESSSLQYF